jgi:hypothetical protein
MPKQEYYRKLFFIGALWNWAATLTFAAGYPVLFPLFGMAMPTYPVFFLMFLGLAFVFGIGYYMVSRDLVRNRDIATLGVIGKLFVFVALLWAGISGQIHFIMIGAGIVDLIFAILYMEFLSTLKKHGA